MATKQLAKLKNLKAEIKIYEERIIEISNFPKSVSVKNGYSISKIIDTKSFQRITMK